MNYAPCSFDRSGLFSDPAVHVSIFRSVSETRNIEKRNMSWGEVVKEIENPPQAKRKQDLPLLKLAEFGVNRNSNGSLRYDGNVIKVWGVEADYDDGKITPESAVEMLRAAGIQAVVYTTPSHALSKPRWRVLTPFSSPMEPSRRAEYVSLLNGALGGVLAPESWKLSQTYYLGSVIGVDYHAYVVDGLPLDVIALCPSFDSLPPSTCQASGAVLPTEKPRLLDDVNDPVVLFLQENSWVKEICSDGRVHVECPWEEEHTCNSVPSASTYFPVGLAGKNFPGYKCHHAHCAGRRVGDFLKAIGYTADVRAASEGAGLEPNQRLSKFVFQSCGEFANGPPPAWIVKEFLPQAELAVIYGESGSGKSFFALDLVAAIARGSEWRGKKVQQGRVAYIAAEGANGFRKRLIAYAKRHSVDLNELPLVVCSGAPNFLQEDDKEVAQAIAECGGASVIVVDTLAQTTPGANENAGEDMGKVLAHCKRLHSETGALVVLIHHSGKDAARGARGWSGIRAAVDVEVEITRKGIARLAKVTKQKDGEDGDTFGFQLEPVLVGIDEEGDEITSCIVVSTEAPVAAPVKPKGKWKGLLYDALQQAVDSGEMEVDADELVNAAVALDEEGAAQEGKRDRRVEVAKRALQELVDEAVLLNSNGRVSFPRPSTEDH